VFAVTDAQINAWLAVLLWPFFRILGVMSVDPFLSTRGVPVRVRIGLALMMTILIANAIPPMPKVPTVSALGIVIIMEQIIIGAAMGYVMRIVFTSIEMAGNLIGLQMGLGFASFFDPQHGANTAVVAQLASLLTLLLFLSMDGHLVVIQTIAKSFQLIPISDQLMNVGALKTLVSWAGEIFKMGVLLSLPVLAALLITNLSIGVMNRAAPQFNVFAVGFPLTMSVGFAALYFSMPQFAGHVHRLVIDATQMAYTLAHQMAGAAEAKP
jgi:flagellar biosynthetic protein FliR